MIPRPVSRLDLIVGLGMILFMVIGFATFNIKVVSGLIKFLKWD